ncbi:MAG: response regulator transcription factor [Chlamydiae bacterium]|nr:response regulator transcription factor [Chlamydiota bacterium]
MASSKKDTVLIVEDDEDILQILTLAFKSKGFNTKGFANGKEALSYLMKKENTDSACLLVLDRLLPDMDGLEILKKLQEKFPNKLPVLILSALSAEKDVLEGLKKGAVAYEVKPFSISVLMQKALVLMNRRV